MGSAAEVCQVIGQPDLWLLFGQLGSFPIWTTQNDSQNQNMASSLFVCAYNTEAPGAQTPCRPERRSRTSPPLPPSAPQEDALCSKHSSENLWQHQRAARCLSNLTSNEKQASCTSAITTASSGGEPTLRERHSGTVASSTEKRRSPEMRSVSDE